MKLCKLYGKVSPEKNVFLWLKPFNILLGERRDRTGHLGGQGRCLPSAEPAGARSNEEDTQAL